MSKIYTLIKPADSPRQFLRRNSQRVWWAYGREPEQDGERESPDLRLSLEDKHSFVGFHTLISIKFFPARAQVLVLDQVDRLTRGINILHALGWRSDWKGDAEAQGINPWATEVIKVRHFEHGQVQNIQIIEAAFVWQNGLIMKNCGAAEILWHTNVVLQSCRIRVCLVRTKKKSLHREFKSSLNQNMMQMLSFTHCESSHNLKNPSKMILFVTHCAALISQKWDSKNPDTNFPTTSER